MLWYASLLLVYCLSLHSFLLFLWKSKEWVIKSFQSIQIGFLLFAATACLHQYTIRSLLTRCWLQRSRFLDPWSYRSCRHHCSFSASLSAGGREDGTSLNVQDVFGLVLNLQHSRYRGLFPDLNWSRSCDGTHFTLGPNSCAQAAWARAKQIQNILREGGVNHGKSDGLLVGFVFGTNTICNVNFNIRCTTFPTKVTFI